MVFRERLHSLRDRLFYPQTIDIPVYKVNGKVVDIGESRDAVLHFPEEGIYPEAVARMRNVRGNWTIEDIKDQDGNPLEPTSDALNTYLAGREGYINPFLRAADETDLSDVATGDKRISEILKEFFQS